MKIKCSRKYRVGLIVWLLVFGVAIAECLLARGADRARSYEDVHRASCRVYACSSGGRGSFGSGTIFAVTDSEYYVLTNNHVTGGWSRFECHFFGTGHQKSVPARLVFHVGNSSGPYDFAILSIEEQELRDYDPPYVPIAREDGLKPEKDKEVIFSGCSEGRWAAVWKGHFTTEPGRTVQFLPAPKGGQSGSGMIQYDPSGLPWLVAILTWRIGTENDFSEAQMTGGAIPMANLYEALRRQKPAGDWQLPRDWTPVAEPVADSLPLDREGTSPVPNDLPGPDWHYAIVEADAPEAPAPTLYKDCKFTVLFFCSSGCPPCELAKPIMASLRRQGYPIFPDLCVSNERQAKEAAEKFKIQVFPTTVLVATWPNGTTRELHRIMGVSNLEEQVKTLLARYGWSPEKTTQDQGMSAETRQRRDKQSPPEEPNESEEYETPDSGGDPDLLLKLLDGSLEEDSILGEPNAAPPGQEKEDPQESPHDDAANDSRATGSSRLLDRAADRIADKAQLAIEQLAKNAEAAVAKRIDSAADGLVVHAKTLLTDQIGKVGTQLEAHVKAYLAKVYLAAVLFVVVASWSLYQGLPWIKRACLWLIACSGFQITRRAIDNSAQHKSIPGTPAQNGTES
ncbi:MAG: hypothetical protein Q4G68_02115 [Planctomycetia bacterium]|nr:hypothetical protein [Planctomycetia bacterium]